MRDSRRTYVIDTSVLLSDPKAIFRFDEHNVVLPVVVVTELEAKRSHPELGYFARQALRLLDDLRVENGRLDANIQPGKREKIVSKYPTATSEYLTPEISKIEDSVLAEQAPAYQCPMCSYVYAPAQGDLREGFEPGTPFSQIPSTWVCPDCGVRERNEFLPLASV